MLAGFVKLVYRVHRRQSRSSAKKHGFTIAYFHEYTSEYRKHSMTELGNLRSVPSLGKGSTKESITLLTPRT